MEFSFPFREKKKKKKKKKRQARPRSGPKLIAPLWSHLQKGSDEEDVGSLTLSPDEIQLQRGGGGGEVGALQLLCFSAPKLLLSWPKINLFPAFGPLESPVKCHTGSHRSKLWPLMGYNDANAAFG